MSNQRPSGDGRGDALGEISLVAGLIAAAFSFFPVVGEVVAVPAALIAVVAGGLGVHRWTCGATTNVTAATFGSVLGLCALIMVLLVVAATSSPA